MQLLEGVNHCSEYVRKCLACIRDTLCFIICLVSLRIVTVCFCSCICRWAAADFVPGQTSVIFGRVLLLLHQHPAGSVLFSLSGPQRASSPGQTHTCTQIFRSFDFPSFFHHRSLFFLTRLPSTFQSSVSRWQKEKVKHKEVYSSIWQLINI